MSVRDDLDRIYPNNSGDGKNSPVPRELQKWNWGAFVFNWIWGLANETYIALICFIPLAIFVMPFILGAKGNEWAWQNRHWKSIAHFQRVQRGWAIAALMVLPITGAGIIWMLVSFSSLFGELGTVRALAAERLRDHPAAVAALGEPIKIDGVQGFHIESNLVSRTAEIVLSVSGPLARGTLSARAIGIDGEWGLTRFDLSVLAGQIDLLEDR